MMLLGRSLPVADTRGLFAFTFSRCVLAARVACFQFTSFFVVVLDTRYAASFFSTRVSSTVLPCTTFEFPVEVSRCDVEKCQRRLRGSERLISILGTTIADREVGSIVQQVPRYERNTWSSRLLDNSGAFSRTLCIERFSHDRYTR